MKIVVLMCAIVMLVTPRDARADEDSLTSAKIAADLADSAEAERLLALVANDGAESGARRGEAWTRLGAIRRARGDSAGAGAAFRDALAQGGGDPGVLGLLARTIEGASADDAVITAALGKATLFESNGRLRLDLGTSASGCMFDSQAPVTLSMEDADLADAVWLISQAGGMSIVTPRCLSAPSRRVSLDLRGVPAGEALDWLVRAQGLSCARQGRILLLGCAGAPPLPASTCAVTEPNPITIEVKMGDSRDILRLFGEVLGAKVMLAPCASTAPVSLRLDEIAASDVLCAIARTNGWVVRRDDEGLHVGCAGDAASSEPEMLSNEWRVQDVIATLAQAEDRDVVMGRNVRGRATMSSTEQGRTIDAILASQELRVVDVGGIQLIVPVADGEAMSRPAGVPADFPSGQIPGATNRTDAWGVASLVMKATGRLVIPGCRAVGVDLMAFAKDAPAGAYLDAWCRASGLQLRASGPALFAWEPPCEGPKGEIVRASARDGSIVFEAKDVLAPHAVAALNLLTDGQVRLDVALRERTLSLGGTWGSPEDVARALAVQLETQATWSEPSHAWLVGPSSAAIFGDGYRRYAVRAESMSLGAWLEIARPLAGWNVAVADSVDLTRAVPLGDFYEAMTGAALIFELEYRTPYHVKWTEDGIAIGP